eukprot:8432906-Pyramimonas_sp.AAC.1
MRAGTSSQFNARTCLQCTAMKIKKGGHGAMSGGELDQELLDPERANKTRQEDMTQLFKHCVRVQEKEE